MHGLLAEEVLMKKTSTADDVEKRFDGNLCRCTGYRPILQSFRKLVETTTPSERKKMMAEMESKHSSASHHIRMCEKKKAKSTSKKRLEKSQDSDGTYESCQGSLEFRKLVTHRWSFHRLERCVSFF